MRKEESQYGAQIPNTPENVAETLGWLLNNLIAKSVTPEAQFSITIIGQDLTDPWIISTLSITTDSQERADKRNRKEFGF